MHAPVNIKMYISFLKKLKHQNIETLRGVYGMDCLLIWVASYLFFHGMHLTINKYPKPYSVKGLTANAYIKP